MATTNEFDRVLDECLDRVLAHGESVEACLQRYPGHASELAPLLHLALESKRTLDFTPAAAAKTRARLLLQAAIARREARKEQRWRWPRLPRMAGAPRWAISTAAVVILMAIGGSGIVAASSDSMPDQPLYPVKRTVEDARLMFTFSSDSKAQLHAKFADRRVREIAVLSRKGKAHRVERLTADLDRHLRRVQRSAVPGAIPARPLQLLKELASQDLQTPVPIAPGIAPPRLNDTDEAQQRRRLRSIQAEEGEGIAKARPLSPKALRLKRAIRRELVAGFKRQDEALQQAIAEAEGPTKLMLRHTLRVLREHRRALLAALSEEPPTPKSQATSTRPRRNQPEEHSELHRPSDG